MTIREAIKTYNAIIRVPGLYAQLQTNFNGNYLVYEYADENSYTPDAGDYCTLTGDRRRLTLARVRELEADTLKTRELFEAVLATEPGSEAHDQALTRYENHLYACSQK